MKSILEIKKMSTIDTSSLSSAKRAVEEIGCEWKDWYYEKAVRPDSCYDIRFWHSERKSRIEDVPVSMIIGQEHGRYEFCQEEPNWIAILQNMYDRWKGIEPEAVKKDLERCNRGNDPVELYKYGKFYFISQGIHRAVHAKFLELETMRCSVTEYIHDDISHSYYLRLSKIVGKKAFDEQKSFTNIQKIHFCWHNLYFTIEWNNVCIDEFERQVNKVKSIMKCPIKKAYYKLKYMMQANPKKHFEFMNESAHEMPDIRTALIYELMTH